MKKRIHQVIINERDCALFSYLYECKVANAKQICRDIFKGTSITVFYRRVNKLIKMKYIKRIPYFNGKNNVSSYSLTKQGLRKFVLDDEKEETIKRCLSDSVEHDLALVDIRKLLMNCNSITDYYSENLLQSYSPIVRREEFDAFRKVSSDAIAVYKIKKDVFHMAIEYEHSLKYTKRYNHLFREYYYQDSIPAVLYICRDTKILRRVMQIELKIKRDKDDKVFFALIEDLKKNPKSLNFISSSQNKITIN